jgi:hypothetical protein
MNHAIHVPTDHLVDGRIYLMQHSSRGTATVLFLGRKTTDICRVRVVEGTLKPSNGSLPTVEVGDERDLAISCCKFSSVPVEAKEHGNALEAAISLGVMV